MRPLLLLLSALTVPRAACATPPNILLLLTDQHRAEALGCAGNRAVRTPNLDWLAETGVRFTRHYSSTPTCTPARAALLTGRSPWSHGLLGYGEVFSNYTARSLEMGGAMAAAGYTTTAIGKNHFEYGRDDTRYTHGYQTTQVYDGLGSGFANTTAPGDFDDYDSWFAAQTGGADPLATGKPLLDWNSWRGAPYAFDESLHPTAWVGARGVQFVRAAAAAAAPQPFFLKLSFHRPHSPYDPPGRLLNATLAAELPPIYAGGTCNWDAPFRNASKWCGPASPDAWCGEMPPGEVDLSRRAYYAGISFVDEWVGAVLRELEAGGLLNSTFILFSSDHGDALSDHWHWRKGYPYESVANVPLIVRWHDGFPSLLPRGSVVSNAVTELRDVLPTLLDVAGTYGEDLPLDGVPLTCLLSGACAPARGGPISSPPPPSSPARGVWREYLDLEHAAVYNASVAFNALTDGAVKYVFSPLTGREQLFDLTADPHEMTDVAGEPAWAAVVAAWRARLVAQFEAEARGPVWVVNGTLQLRPNSPVYGPNYPKAATTALGGGES